MAKQLTLQERVDTLHKEIDELVERHISEHRPDGVPADSVRQMIFGRARGCKCRELKLAGEKSA